MSEYHRKRARWDLIASAVGVGLALTGAAYGIYHNVSRSDDTAPQPAPASVVVRSPLAEQLQIQDCPTEDVMDMICAWDSQTGRDFVAVYGEIFWVGTNDDGTLWVDFNHDGEEGYPDA